MLSRFTGVHAEPKVLFTWQRAAVGVVAVLLILLAAVACVALAFIMRTPLANSLAVPFFKNVLFNLGWFFVVFGAFIIVGAGNAVNLTDGLDGLAIVPVMIAAASFGMISYLTGNAVFSSESFNRPPVYSRKSNATLQNRCFLRNQARHPVCSPCCDALRKEHAVSCLKQPEPDLSSLLPEF